MEDENNVTKDDKLDEDEDLLKVAEELEEDLDDEYKALIPDVSPAKRIEWIKNAKKNNLFVKDASAGEKGGKEDKEDKEDKEEKNKERSIPKSRFNSVNLRRKLAEEELESVAALICTEVPEDMKGLIPSDLSAAKQIAWVLEAKRIGIFSKSAAKAGLDSRRPGSKVPLDFSKMKPAQALENSYK